MSATEHAGHKKAADAREAYRGASSRAVLGDRLFRGSKGTNRWMVALTGDLYLLGPRLLANLTAIHLSCRHDATARQVGTGFWFIVRHANLQNNGNLSEY